MCELRPAARKNGKSRVSESAVCRMRVLGTVDTRQVVRFAVHIHVHVCIHMYIILYYTRITRRVRARRLSTFNRCAAVARIFSTPNYRRHRVVRALAEHRSRSRVADRRSTRYYYYNYSVFFTRYFVDRDVD